MFRDFQATSSVEKGRLAETRIGEHQGHALRAAGAQLARPRKTSPRKAKGHRSKTRDGLAKVLEPVTGIEPATH